MPDPQIILKFEYDMALEKVAKKECHDAELLNEETNLLDLVNEKNKVMKDFNHKRELMALIEHYIKNDQSNVNMHANISEMLPRINLNLLMRLFFDGPLVHREYFNRIANGLKFKRRNDRLKWLNAKYVAIDKIINNKKKRFMQGSLDLFLIILSKLIIPRYIGSFRNFYLVLLFPEIWKEVFQKRRSLEVIIENNPGWLFSSIQLAFGQRIFRMQSNQKPEFSDLGDEMHLLYLNATEKFTIDSSSLSHLSNYLKYLEGEANRVEKNRPEWIIFQEWKRKLTPTGVKNSDWKILET